MSKPSKEGKVSLGCNVHGSDQWIEDWQEIKDGQRKKSWQESEARGGNVVMRFDG